MAKDLTARTVQRKKRRDNWLFAAFSILLFGTLASCLSTPKNKFGLLASPAAKKPGQKFEKVGNGDRSTFLVNKCWSLSRSSLGRNLYGDKVTLKSSAECSPADPINWLITMSRPYSARDHAASERRYVENVGGTKYVFYFSEGQSGTIYWEIQIRYSYEGFMDVHIAVPPYPGRDVNAPPPQFFRDLAESFRDQYDLNWNSVEELPEDSVFWFNE